VIRVGPAGWQYKDWRGIVYPQRKPKGFDELAYVAKYFDTVEINTSYYGPPRESTATKWLKSVAHNPAFRFTGKLFHGFTHEKNASTEDEHLVKSGFAPLLDADRLGAVLMQFPWSFRNTPQNREYVMRLRGRFAEFPMVLEVRHASWNEVGILDWLQQIDLGLCNIDQPLFKRSIKPGAMATTSSGYIRLHGRNYKTWFAENAQSHERYDYLYNVDELDPWIHRAKAVAEQTEDTYVVTNNHYLGKAVVNAIEISSILRQKTVAAPPELLERYPELRGFTSNEKLT
jgi:uncharacterized protein YecE (DUF72 family)